MIAARMYRRILVALDTTPSDQELLLQVTELARLLRSDLLLLHVADGWVARNFEKLKLAESEEMKQDRSYLEDMAAQWRTEAGPGIEIQLALGDPVTRILEVASDAGCDLIAMASHGHRLVGDIFRGATIEAVRHRARVPLWVAPPRVP